MQNKTSIMDIVNSNNITTQDALKIIARLSKEQVLETNEGGHNILHVLAADPEVHSSNLDIERVVKAIVAKNPEVLNARLEILFTNPSTNEAESLEGDTPFDMAIRQNNLVLVKVLAPHCKGLKDIRIFDYSPGKQRLKTQKEIADQKTRTREYNKKNDYNTETEPLPTKTVDNIREHMSPLAFCLRHGQFEMFQYFIENGFGPVKGIANLSKYNLANPETENLQELYKDLFVAGNKELLKELHRHLGYYEGHEGENSEELIAAVSADNQEKALELISQGHYVYDFSKFEYNNNNNNEIKVIKFFFLNALQHPNYNILARDEYGNTPLHLAARRRDKEIAVLIIEAAKENPELLKTLFAPNNCGDTPLYLAVDRGMTAYWVTVERGNVPLLWDESGADTEIAVALIEAAKENPELLKTLFAPNDCDDTPLHSAASQGLTEIAVELLKAAKINPELLKTLFAPGDEGYTPLHLAALHDHKKMAVLIIKAAKGNPELLKTLFAPDYAEDYTPLHLAANEGNKKIVRELLKYDESDVLLENKEGETAADVAKTPKIRQIIEDHIKAKAEQARALNAASSLSSSSNASSSTAIPTLPPSAAVVVDTDPKRKCDDDSEARKAVRVDTKKRGRGE